MICYILNQTLTVMVKTDVPPVYQYWFFVNFNHMILSKVVTIFVLINCLVFNRFIAAELLPSP
jgi:hypothetical protein